MEVAAAAAADEATATSQTGAETGPMPPRNSSNSSAPLQLSVTSLSDSSNGSGGKSHAKQNSASSSGAASLSSSGAPEDSAMGQSDSLHNENGGGGDAGLEPSEENFRKLRAELAALKTALRDRDEEVDRLSRIRGDMEAELEDLTASLFEEANKMVRDANVKQASSEKFLVEANMKIDGLETEVAALKTLVLTSTPSQPNKHLHPQIDPKNSRRRSAGKGKETVDGNSSAHYSPRSLHNGHMTNGSNSSLSSPQSSLVLVNNASTSSAASSLSSAASTASANGDAAPDQSPMKHIDPVLRKEYLAWKKSPTMDRTASAFIERIYREDIDPCLDFASAEVCGVVVRAVHDNTLCIEPVTDFAKVPRDCALLQVPVLCRFHVRVVGDSKAAEEGFYISQTAATRFRASCEM